MLVSGIFIIDELKEKDAEGFESVARAHNQMEENITADLYLTPYLRPSRCDIKAGSKVWGIADTVTGYGAALAGIDCDVTFTDKNNYHYTKTLTVDGACDFKDTLTVDKATTMKDKLDVTKNITSSTGDIKANVGDVVATTVSLKTHVHTVPTTAIPTAMPNNPAVPAVFPGATTTTPT